MNELIDYFLFKTQYGYVGDDELEVIQVLDGKFQAMEEEICRLAKENNQFKAESDLQSQAINALEAENERLKQALSDIVNEDRNWA